MAFRIVGLVSNKKEHEELKYISMIAVEGMKWRHQDESNSNRSNK